VTVRKNMAIINKNNCSGFPELGRRVSYRQQRHVAISRFFEKSLNVMEVYVITVPKDQRIL